MLLVSLVTVEHKVPDKKPNGSFFSLSLLRRVKRILAAGPCRFPFETEVYDVFRALYRDKLLLTSSQIIGTETRSLRTADKCRIERAALCSWYM